jgi:hypothetical protein
VDPAGIGVARIVRFAGRLACPSGERRTGAGNRNGGCNVKR